MGRKQAHAPPGKPTDENKNVVGETTSSSAMQARKGHSLPGNLTKGKQE